MKKKKSHNWLSSEEVSKMFPVNNNCIDEYKKEERRLVNAIFGISEPNKLTLKQENMKQPRFKKGDEVILISKDDRGVLFNNNWFDTDVESDNNAQIGSIFTVKQSEDAKEGTVIDLEELFYWHDAKNFRKVERIKYKPISTDKLKRGDIVKFNPSDKAKFVVAYITKDIVYFYPTRTKHPYIESDRQVPMMKLYSVIVYKLLNVKDLCK